jgi:uncharacterized SAM-binding protein YcdF (DUF218 family)
MNFATRSGYVRSGDDTPARRRRLPKSVRIILRTALALIVIFAAATARLLVWPPDQGTPSNASAIVMLAGSGIRLPVALQLADQHRAPVLVVSQGHDGAGGPCPARPPGVQLICFDPVPSTTRGEAEYIGRLAQKYHWTSVIVVTSRPQAFRAHMLIKRCFAGSVYGSTGPLPKRNWPYEIAYGWGALAKAFFTHRSC